MPGRRHQFSAKEDRQASHIAESEQARGMSPQEARSVGYATVNKRKSRGARRRSKRG